MRRNFSLSVLSGFLLTLAFPRWNLWWLAWVAFVPLLRAITDSKNWKTAFLYGFSAGFTFYLLSLTWLRHVTVFGLFFVAALLAIYWGIFAVMVRRNNGLLLLAAAWTALEFLRSEWPVWGFGWNLLGYSQAPNVLVRQLASLGGAYAVSFLVLLGNGVLHRALRDGLRKTYQTVLLFFLLLSAVLLFGWSRLAAPLPRPDFRISVLQGNISQVLKWEPKYKEEILRIYLNLTELAGYDHPQMILWPESAYPGFFNLDPEAERVKELVRKIKIPLLVGSPHDEGRDFYYNSAYLLNASGEISERYDKIRLVPFGEYVPWKRAFGFLERYAYALGVSDFSPGKNLTVFERPRFSVLICFEDTFPGLARKFVERGAGFLAVITNDAWFGHSSAPYQHLQASVFRAIENGVAVVRAANTGISGFVSSRGEVEERVRNPEGKDTFVMGGLTSPIVSRSEMTLYRQGGWLFPYVCLAAVILYLMGATSMTPVILISLFSGCIRLQGGAFYAKKNAEGETKVKEAYVDTDELVKKRAPGNIET